MNDSFMNPFDNESLTFNVLVNQRNQYSIWPEFATIPSGWTCFYGPESHANCLSYIETHWTDIRPE